MPTRHAAAIFLAALVAACSSLGPESSSAPSPAPGETTTPTRAPGQPASVDACPNYVLFPETGPLPSDFNEGHPINLEHERLEPDLQAALTYAEAHPDEFGSIRWENVPTVRVVIGFTDHLGEHCAALRKLMAFPDEFQLIWAAATETDKASIADAILAKYREHLTSVGQGGEVVEVTLRADGAAAAAEITAEYGALVNIWVGMLHYPDGQTAEGRTCQDLLPTPAVGLPLRASLRLARTEIPSGDDFKGTVTVLNFGNQPFEFESGEPQTALVFAPRGTVPVGAYVGGIAGVGRAATLQPGGSIDLSVVGGTASCDAAVGYAVPPGEAVVAVPVDVYARDQPDAPVTILHLFSDVVPIRIIP